MVLGESIKYDCGGIREEFVRTSHEIVEYGIWRLAHFCLQIKSSTPVHEDNHPLDLLT